MLRSVQRDRAGGAPANQNVTIRANWRIIFRFEDGDVTDIDLIDYH